MVEEIMCISKTILHTSGNVCYHQVQEVSECWQEAHNLLIRNKLGWW